LLYLPSEQSHPIWELWNHKLVKILPEEQLTPLPKRAYIDHLPINE
jgi:hypothetical protein